MEWIDAKLKTYPYNKNVLVCVKYLDAEWDFELGGYKVGTDFYTSPIVVIANISNELFGWSCGGLVTFWMSIPKQAEE